MTSEKCNFLRECFTEKKPWSRDTIIILIHTEFMSLNTRLVLSNCKKNQNKQKREDKESETGVTRVEGARKACLV